ncbi:flotillin family protein, partial [[Eubacterium] rectale]|nr:flotillin family protein [Agathobacter rectalis]
QSYSYLDLNPINIDVPLQGALSSQNIRVDVPSSFIVGISTLPEIMQNAAARLLGRSREEIRNLAAEIIMGQMRVVIAS